jgi:hypothetical protein
MVSTPVPRLGPSRVIVVKVPKVGGYEGLLACRRRRQNRVPVQLDRLHPLDLRQVGPVLGGLLLRLRLLLLRLGGGGVLLGLDLRRGRLACGRLGLAGGGLGYGRLDHPRRRHVGDVVVRAGDIGAPDPPAQALFRNPSAAAVQKPELALVDAARTSPFADRKS